jgi:hypothetical protein
MCHTNPLAKVNDRLAVWRHLHSFLLHFSSPLAKVNDRLAVWRHSLRAISTLFSSTCKSERLLSGLKTKEIERHVERHVGAPHNPLGECLRVLESLGVAVTESPYTRMRQVILSALHRSVGALYNRPCSWHDKGNTPRSGVVAERVGASRGKPCPRAKQG